ncbi:MAG: hypothetical protein R2739_04790 [Chitinophagales bacterium]|nr:hypothetical protein [Bacteroidota bacterium]
MNINLTFNKTLVGSLKSKINVDVWQLAKDAYEQKDYSKTVRACINYINPEIEQKYANAEKTEYKIPHGSIIVYISISDTTFSVSAPFLNIEGAQIIPILRQVAQLNFNPLVLSQVVLEEQQLYFKYACPIDMCEPYKVYNVLREICVNADNLDDEFISKLNAKNIQEPIIYNFTQEEKETIYTSIQLYIKEAFETYKELENNRRNAYLWDILIITLLKIDYYCSPQGGLRIELEKAISYMNSNAEYYQRLGAATSFLQMLQKIDKESFEKDLYKIDVFVPYKYSSDLETVKAKLKITYETAEKELKAKEYLGTVLTIEYGILNFFFGYNVEDKIADILTKAMENASAKPLQEAADTLFLAIKEVMNISEDTATTTPQENNNEKKGFFSRLFS